MSEFNFSAGMTQQVWQFQDLVLKSRFARALEQGAARYPIQRTVRFAARIELEKLFDEIATRLGWAAQRLDSHSLILDGEGLFITAYGGRKAEYCSCIFHVWADTAERAERARQLLLEKVGEARIREPMFSIDWHFLTAKGELESASIEELANDVLHDAAYPEMLGGLPAFIGRYLAAPEPVLVLQGPPGTGKTRLIRAILGEISRRNQGTAQALYTGDKKALETDQVFVEFITGWHDVFVVEDADHLLKPRVEGNENLHRFLTIADGIVRSQGRKIIFSTNLPNVGDLDDALVRPGRCFARLLVRELSRGEANILLRALCGKDDRRFRSADEALSGSVKRAYSLAEVYRVFEQAK